MDFTVIGYCADTYELRRWHVVGLSADQAIRFVYRNEFSTWQFLAVFTGNVKLLSQWSDFERSDLIIPQSSLQQPEQMTSLWYAENNDKTEFFTNTARHWLLHIRSYFWKNKKQADDFRFMGCLAGRHRPLLVRQPYWSSDIWAAP